MLKLSNQLTNELTNLNLTGWTLSGLSAGSHFTNAFQNCSKVTSDSLMTLINSLYDFSSSSDQRNLQLSQAGGFSSLTSSQIQVATDKGWTII